MSHLEHLSNQTPLERSRKCSEGFAIELLSPTGIHCDTRLVQLIDNLFQVELVRAKQIGLAFQ